MPDQPPQVIMPLSPMNRMPLPPSPKRCRGSLGSIPLGTGGRSPPSYQVMVTAGMSPRGPKRYVWVAPAGEATSSSISLDVASTLKGCSSFKANTAGSMLWQAMSPMAPVPKAHHPRQLYGA